MSRRAVDPLARAVAAFRDLSAHEKETFMLASNRTPDPWDLHTYVFDGGTMAFYLSGPISTEEAEANRALMQAAPELLRALKNCVDGLGCQPGYVNTLALSVAQQAIAKAEGRS